MKKKRSLLCAPDAQLQMHTHSSSCCRIHFMGIKTPISCCQVVSSSSSSSTACLCKSYPRTHTHTHTHTHMHMHM